MRADEWTPAQARSLSWSAVYGAYVAAQVMERIRRGYGSPGDDEWDGIVEEARAVADCADEAAERAAE